MKNKMIYLDAYITIPTKEAEEKIENATKKDEPKLNYDALGMRPPKGELEIDEYGNVILEDEDLEEITVSVSMPIDSISSYVQLVEGGTKIYTKHNIAYEVVQECWEIDAFLEMMNMSWLERLKLSFLSFFRRKQNTQIEIEFELEQ